MAHFAKLDENDIVTEVIVIYNNELIDENGQEIEQKGIDFCVNLFGGRWIQTSYNNRFRKNYAGISFSYDAGRDAFISPKSFESWTLNEDTCRWDPPVPYPTDDKFYDWNEDTLSWVIRG